MDGRSGYEELEERFVAWAQTCSDIRAAFVIGSRARVDDRPADEWADLDIAVVVTNPDRYLSRADWMENMGNPLLAFVEAPPAGSAMEHRVLFEGGLDVDFVIVPNSRAKQITRFLPILKRFPILFRLVPKTLVQELALVADLLGRGFRVLVDKDGLAAKVPLVVAQAQPPQPPTQREFARVDSDFWHHALWAVKHLRRGELWWAKSACDGRLKELLLQMTEWHAKATHGWEYDTWQRGRFLEQWADPRAVEGLRSAFAHYDQEDLWRALVATMDMFRWLAIETAERLNFPYPSVADEHVTRWVKQLMDPSRTRADEKA